MPILLFLKNWTDELMKWDPVEYDNITQMKLQFNDIWTPGKVFLYIVLIEKMNIFLYVKFKLIKRHFSVELGR